MLLSAAASLGSAIDAGRKNRTLAEFYEAVLFDARFAFFFLFSLFHTHTYYSDPHPFAP
jgi:hypothetical protein